MVRALNVLERVAKIIAISGFFLPWAAIACSQAEVAKGTGLQLMAGELQPSLDLQQLNGGQISRGFDQERRDPNSFALAALLAIMLGLLVSLFVLRRVAAGALLVSSLLGAGLSP